MLRQVKMALATLAGMVTAGLLILAGELLHPRSDYGVDLMSGHPITLWDWVKGTVGIDLPILGLVLVMSLSLLELVQPRIKAPRVLFFVLGGVAFAAMLGGAFAFGVAGFLSFNPPLFEAAFGFATPQQMTMGLFMVPTLVASAAYVLLTKDMVPGAPDPLPEEFYPAPPQPMSPRTAQPAPDSQRIIEILTSPRHRIGQRLFYQGLRIWSLAASVWWGITAVLLMAVGFDRETAFTIAAAGWLVLLWCAFCGIANRLHDFNLNGMLALAPVFAAFAWVLSEPPPSDGWASGAGISRCIIACVFCFALTAAVLLILKGEPYSNRYGPESD